MSNTTIDERKAKLSAAKKALLMKRLKGKKTGGTAAEAGIPKRAAAEPAPLSYSQQRFWFAEQLNPESAVNNMHEAWRIKGYLDLAALERAFNLVVIRQAALRMNIVVQDDVPVQLIAPHRKVSIPVTDLSHLSPTEQAAEIKERATAEARRPFDLEQDTLVRLSALELHENEHVLLYTIHHIISDEYSNDLFWRELDLAYANETKAGLSSLPSLPIQYDDFSEWQADWLEGGAQKEQLAYWTKQLAGDAPVIELPFDRPRPTQQTHAGGFTSRQLDGELIEPLQALSQQTGATPFMTYLAAFQALLQRYSHQNEVWVGTPIANRQRSEVQHLMGLFLNTVVIRSDFGDAGLTFRQLLTAVQKTTLDAFEHQDLPFEKLVDELRPQRDPAYNPLFQVMFVFGQRSEHNQRHLPNTIFSPIRVDGGVAKFELTLFVTINGRELEVGLEYNSDLFDKSTAERILSHFEVLLHGIAQDADRPVSHLPILPEGERKLVVETWNDTAVAYPQEMMLHELIERHAAESPNAVAVQTAAGSLTYGEMDQKADQLAYHLQAQGVRPGKFVGLYTTRHYATIIGVLAILKAGGAYVPIDPEYPAERIAYIIEDAGLALILSGDGAGAEDTAVEMVNIVAYLAGQSLGDRPNRDDQTPEQLAYVIYTSGSTGQPKGVMVSHQNIVHSTTAREHFYAEQPKSFLLLSSFAFDSSMVGLFWTLCAGGTLVLPQDGLQQDVLYLNSLIAQEGVSHLLALPLLYQLLLDESEAGQLDSLRAVIVAGEACHAGLIQAHYGRYPQATLYNEYGPTEGTVWSHAYAFPTDFSGTVVPIGRPIPNMRGYVLDAHNQPVPIGVAGELVLAGEGITRGYLNRPELTREKFSSFQFSVFSENVSVEHQLNTEHRTLNTFYRTGDLVKWRPDGNLLFLGRVDQQVKIRGFRIELGEVEAALLDHGMVKKGAVVVHERPQENGGRPDKQLVGYFVGDAGLTAADLRRDLGQQLPNYMVPTHFVALDKMPLTPNGKIDRKALPEPDVTAAKTSEYIAPTEEREQILAGIWAEVLRLPQVGVQDNFFDLGGDSIISIQIIAKAKRAGLKLTPKQIFEFQTVGELAAVAEAVDGSAAEQGQVTGGVPLTPIQQWFFEQNFAEPNHWNQSLWLEVPAETDTALFKQAAQYLLRQHDALRSVFTQTDEGWKQTISPKAPEVSVTEFELYELSESAQEREMGVQAELLEASLDIEAGQLIKMKLFQRGSGLPLRLFITVHHLVIDGVSWGPLIEDLETTYRQLVEGKEVDLPRKTTSFKKWAELLGKAAGDEAARTFWEYQPSAYRFGNGERDDNTLGNVETVTVTLSEQETTDLLQEVGNVYNTNINDALLTAVAQSFMSELDWMGFSLLLEGHGREEEIIGEKSGGTADLSRTMGWFTTQYPVHVDLDRPELVGEALKVVKEQLRQIPDSGIGYGIERYVAKNAQLQSYAEPDVVFNYLGQLDRSIPSGEMVKVVRPLRGGVSLANRRPHSLGIMCYVREGVLTAVWDYHPALMAAEKVESLAQTFIANLQALIAHCLNADGQEFTASDFELADLDSEQFDQLADLLGGLG